MTHPLPGLHNDPEGKAPAKWGNLRNPVSFLFFSWAYPVLAKGAQSSLSDEDVPELWASWRVEVGLKAYKAAWSGSTKTSALIPLLVAFRGEVALYLCCLIARESAWAMQAVFLKFLVESPRRYGLITAPEEEWINKTSFPP